ncbi:hypothetical protein GF420_04735 [candidate division GN15 bacterium]|nr:hypothetical protein [candidate division GN15 bacterium]
MIEQEILHTFSNTAYLLLVGGVAASLFFAMASFREFHAGHVEGYFYLLLSLFFMAGHFVFMANLPVNHPLETLHGGLGVWGWLTHFLAPALIGLFVVLGLYRLMTASFQAGLVKVFFGLTLLCYLFMVGSHWPADVQGILTLVYTGAWFDLGLRTAA